MRPLHHNGRGRTIGFFYGGSVERVVVVGGDAAGMTAAAQARRLRGPDDLDLVVFEKGNFVSYSACGIPYLIGGAVADAGDLIARSAEESRTRFDIDVRLHSEVTAVDLSARRVEVHDRGGDRTYSETFDQIVFAMGGVPVRPPLDGIDQRGIFGVQTLDDGLAVKRWVEAETPQRAVVVGAGYIGMEMAEALLMQGLEVSVVEAAAQPMTTLDPDMGREVADAMRETGIDLFLGEKVTGFAGANGRVTAVATAERELPADIVVLGLGTRPRVELARDAGLDIGPSGAIAVDVRMAASAPGTWAAGDCAQKHHLVARRPVAIALGTHANKEGRTAGINIGGGYETFPGVVGTAVSKICSLEVARTGLAEWEADEAGFSHLSVVVDSTTRAGYFPGAMPIKTKMTVERNSGRLLGAQIVGREGAAKRIDVIATALWNEMAVDEMLNLDLSYAPPFAPLWDPVLITARKAWQAVEEDAARS